MTRILPVLCTVAAIVVLTSCNSSENTATTSSISTTTAPAVPTNSRGAIEVDLGQPARITDDSGATVLAITGTRLDTDGCTPNLHPEVVHTKFIATIRTGTVETPQWLWPSDIYYVDNAGKVAQNLEVSQAVGEDFACDGSVALIDVPPNSTADGSPTLVVPVMTTAIGYHLKTGDVDQRVEWKLPPNWRQKITPTSTPTPAATEEPEPAPAPVPGTEAPSGGSNLPPGWDKDGDGLIDTDAPIGDVPCDTTECLIEKNREGAEEAERSEGPSPWVRGQLCDQGQVEYC